jgi:hypothetical protein
MVHRLSMELQQAANIPHRLGKGKQLIPKNYNQI